MKSIFFLRTKYTVFSVGGTLALRSHISTFYDRRAAALGGSTKNANLIFFPLPVGKISNIFELLVMHLLDKNN